MLAVEGMFPMGIGLQEPVVSCRPLVRGTLGRPSAQKLAKLFGDVAASAWPAVGGFWPVPVVWMTEGSMVKELWRSPPEPEPALLTGGGAAAVDDVAGGGATEEDAAGGGGGGAAAVVAAGGGAAADEAVAPV